MRIIYSAGNRIGANNQLLRFLENNECHEIKIAGYNNSTYSIKHVDWNLNSIHLTSIFYTDAIHSLRYEAKYIESILKDVADFNPDLIISDSEHIFGHIANEIDVPLWYCSPLNLIEAIRWPKNKPIYSYLFNQYKKHKLPKADKYLIYSPFCDILNTPTIKDNYIWIRPYYNIDSQINIDENSRRLKLNKILKYVKLNEYNFTDGNTTSVSDSFYNNKNIIISPNVKNIEALLNAIMIGKYNIGYNLGQIELMEMKAVEYIERICNKKYSKVEFNNNQHLQLHEFIEKFENNIVRP